MRLNHVRMFLGAALCIYAVVLFAIDLPHVVLVGPFVLFMLGLFVFLGPSKLLRAAADRRARYRSYLTDNPHAQRSETRSKWLERVGYAVFAFGILCWLFGVGNRNWIWIAIAILGLGLGLYRDVVTITGQYKATREKMGRPAEK